MGVALVQGIVALGHSLGLTIVAEGIEVERHAAALRDAGCEFGQGYLFGRAMPAPAFEAYMSAPRGLADVQPVAERAQPRLAGRRSRSDVVAGRPAVTARRANTEVATTNG